MQLCQRYFEPIVHKQSTEGLCIVTYWGSAASYGSLRWNTTKRTTPGMLFSTGSDFKIRTKQADRQCQQMGGAGYTPHHFRPDFNASGGTNGDAGWGATTSNNAYMWIRSEM